MRSFSRSPSSRLHALSVALCLAMPAFVACSGAKDGLAGAPGDLDDGAGGGSAAGAGGPSRPGENGAGGAASGGSAGAGGMALPPEQEVAVDVEAPRAGARFVFVANPGRDTVAIVDSTTLAIRTVQAGDTPATLQTLPGRDVALALNVGSHDVTVVRADAAGASTSTVNVVRGANTLTVAPDGAHAIVWFDPARKNVVKGSALAGNFQEVSVLGFAADGSATSLPLTVGFLPSAVSFAADGSAAFVVTRDGVSVIRFAALEGPAVAPLAGIAPAADPKAPRDVSVSPDGKYAVARVEGEKTARLVDLATGTSVVADLGAPISDLDLAPDGKTAWAVLRDTSSLVALPIPTGFQDPAQRRTVSFAGDALGSVTIAPDGKSAVLYTTAAPLEALVVASLGEGTLRRVPLQKTVRAVAYAANGADVVVVHGRKEGDPNDPSIELDEMIDRSWGYSVVKLTTGAAKLVLTPVAVGPLLVTPDSRYAFVLLRNDAASVRLTQRIHLESQLVTDIPLGSPPLALGALPASQRVFVSQLHPEGRLTFVDWQSGQTASVTGFELNGRIVQ